MYYLKDYIETDKLNVALNTYILNDPKMREKQIKDIVRRLNVTFHDKEYVRALETSDKRWIDKKIDVVLNGITEFAKKIVYNVTKNM